MWVRGDDLADLYAADAVRELPFLFPGLPDRLEGREEVRAAYRAAWAASDAEAQAVRDVAVHPCADSEVLVAEQIVSAIAPSRLRIRTWRGRANCRRGP